MKCWRIHTVDTADGINEAVQYQRKGVLASFLCGIPTVNTRNTIWSQWVENFIICFFSVPDYRVLFKTY
jgi:hypothetical protein